MIRLTLSMVVTAAMVLAGDAPLHAAGPRNHGGHRFGGQMQQHSRGPSMQGNFQPRMSAPRGNSLQQRITPRVPTNLGNNLGKPAGRNITTPVGGIQRPLKPINPGIGNGIKPAVPKLPGNINIPTNPAKPGNPFPGGGIKLPEKPGPIGGKGPKLPTLPGKIKLPGKPGSPFPPGGIKIPGLPKPGDAPGPAKPIDPGIGNGKPGGGHNHGDHHHGGGHGSGHGGGKHSGHNHGGHGKHAGHWWESWGCGPVPHGGCVKSGVWTPCVGVGSYGGCVLQVVSSETTVIQENVLVEESFFTPAGVEGTAQPVAVEVGSTIAIADQGLGVEPGMVLLKVNEITMACQVQQWSEKGIIATLPTLGMEQVLPAELFLIGATGDILNAVQIQLVPLTPEQVAATLPAE